MFSGHPLVAGLFVWKKRPQRGWVAGAGAVIPMRQAGQPGACVNAPLRPPVPEANTVAASSLTLFTIGQTLHHSRFYIEVGQLGWSRRAATRWGPFLFWTEGPF
jgi:hypothetical protein